MISQKNTIFGIVIPCYNEAECLPGLIRELKVIANDQRFKFIIVNNGSIDNSKNILENAELGANISYFEIAVNQGYGYGVKEGLKQLDTPVVGWMHADMQTPPSELLNFGDINPDDRIFIKGRRINRSAREKFFTSGMTFFMSMKFRTKLSDINAQPTLMSVKLFDSWVNAPDDFGLDLYAYAFAKKNHARVIRFKVNFGDRLAGSSSWNRGLRSQIKFSLKLIKAAYSIRKDMQ